MTKSKSSTPATAKQAAPIIENKPKAWEIQQRREILRDHRNLVAHLWQRAIVEATPEVRELLLAMRALDHTCNIWFGEDDRRSLLKDNKFLEPTSKFWTHERIWADVHRAERALHGGDFERIANVHWHQAEADEKNHKKPV